MMGLRGAGSRTDGACQGHVKLTGHLEVEQIIADEVTDQARQVVDFGGRD